MIGPGIGVVSRVFHSGMFPGGRPLGDFAFQELMPSLKCSERSPQARADRGHALKENNRHQEETSYMDPIRRGRKEGRKEGRSRKEERRSRKERKKV